MKKLKKTLWVFAQGWVQLAEALTMILSLGFIHPSFYGDFMEFKLRRMFKKKINFTN